MSSKTYILFLILIICSTIALANITNQEYEIIKGSSIFLEGKNISVVTISKDSSVLFDVDGQRDKIGRGDSATISGVNIFVEDILAANSALVNITINFTCGNNICELGESSKICCIDCNCTKGFTCSQNRCLDILKTNCNVNKDCNDKNKCTTDICELTTKTCLNEPVRKCSNDDSCCPYGCTKGTDNDCKVGSCSDNKDCNDKNKCTTDICTNGLCEYKGNECEYNGECNPIGIIINNSYCFDKTWHALKAINISCKGDYECNSNVCKEGKCVERDSQLVTNKVKSEVNKYTYTVIIILVIIVVIEVIVLIRKKY